MPHQSARGVGLVSFSPAHSNRARCQRSGAGPRFGFQGLAYSHLFAVDHDLPWLQGRDSCRSQAFTFGYRPAIDPSSTFAAASTHNSCQRNTGGIAVRRKLAALPGRRYQCALGGRIENRAKAVLCHLSLHSLFQCKHQQTKAYEGFPPGRPNLNRFCMGGVVRLESMRNHLSKTLRSHFFCIPSARLKKRNVH